MGLNDMVCRNVLMPVLTEALPTRNVTIMPQITSEYSSIVEAVCSLVLITIVE